MFKLNTFKKHLHAFWRIMIEQDSYVDISFKGRLYRLHVEDMGEAPKRKSKKAKKKNGLVKQIRSSKCKCGALMINGVCMHPERH